MPHRREEFGSSSSSNSSLLRPLRTDREEEHAIYSDEAAQQQQRCSAVGQQVLQQQQVQRNESYYGTSSYDHVLRTCFICLEGAKRSTRDPLKRRDLHSCCTQCFVVVHKNCWAAYRRRQQLAAFRARLLGQRAPTPHLCTVCKTGRAGVTGDAPLLPRGGKRRRRSSAAAAAAEAAGGEAEAAGGGSRGRSSTVLQEQLLASLGRLLQEDDEDADRPPLCTGICMCINTGLLLVVLLVDLLLMALTYVYPLQVLLVSLFICYNAVVLQILVLAVRQRREYMRTYLAAETEGLENNEESDTSSSSGASGGRRGRPEESRSNPGAADGRRSRRRSSGDGEEEEGAEDYAVYADEELEAEAFQYGSDGSTSAAAAAGGGRARGRERREAADSSSPVHVVLRSMFFSFQPPSRRLRSSSSEGRRGHRNSSSRNSNNNQGRWRSSNMTSGMNNRGEAFLDRDTRGTDWRIGELWIAAKRFYFSLMRDAWEWTENNTAAVGDPLMRSNRRDVEILQDTRSIVAQQQTAAAAAATTEYYTRAEATVEPQLAADVEMQVLNMDIRNHFAPARGPQEMQEIVAQS